MTNLREDELRRRAVSFGTGAERYDRARPGYPDALLRDVIRLAGRSHPLVAEVGAGTGKATVRLAELGARVVAIEPDGAMAALGRRNTETLGIVTIVASRFEDWQPEQPHSFDLVAAAQSWHWVEPARGSKVAHGALRPGGWLARWWNRPRRIDGDLHAELSAVYGSRAPELRDSSVISEPAGAALRSVDRDRAPGFGPPMLRHYDWTQPYSTSEYLDLVQTHSDHIAFPTARLRALLGAIAETIESAGGGVTLGYRTELVAAPALPSHHAP